MSIILSNHDSYEYWPWERRTLPASFWRTFHEGSHTPSRYVLKEYKYICTPDTYIKEVSSQVDHDNAFQAHKQFTLEDDLTKEHILKHLNWYNEEGSSFISAFETLGMAEKRAQHQCCHREPRYRQDCVAIAKIANISLVPAIYRRSTVITSSSTSQLKPCDIPIWIDLGSYQPSTRCIEEKEVREHEANIWLSMLEVRKHFNITNGIGQDDEWLACGRILLSRIAQIIPYDGETFFQEPDLDVSCRDYIFNFQHQLWLPEALRVHDLKALEHAQKLWLTRVDSYRIHEHVATEMTSEDYEVSTSDPEGLLNTLRDLLDATKPLVAYYERIPRRTYERGSLEEKAEGQRIACYQCATSCERYSNILKSSMRMLTASEDTSATEADAEDDIAARLEALNI